MKKDHIRCVRIGNAFWHVWNGHILGLVGLVGTRIRETHSKGSHL